LWPAAPKIGPDEAFLTGLLHGIGRLYIMVRSISKAREFGDEQSFIELVAGWQASIGKAVLENWGFAAEMCEAVAEQRDYERKRKRVAELTDVLIVSIVLCEALRMPAPRTVDTEGIESFATIGLSDVACADILIQAELQLGSLQDALGADAGLKTRGRPNTVVVRDNWGVPHVYGKVRRRCGIRLAIRAG